MEVTSPPAISVVVATRNRADSLERLLTQLSEQVDAPSFELIVADSGSHDRTPDILRNAPSRLRVFSVRVDEPGKGRALNAALQLASGALVVFTDDDVEPDPRWLAELHAAAERHPEAQVFGGRIDVDERVVPRWIRRSHNLMGLLTSFHAPADSTYGYGRYPFGPNLAVRRRLIEGAVRPYPERMGPGTSLPVGDESGFLMALSPPEALDRMFVASARVAHEVEPGNVGFREALRRSFHQGRAQGSLGIPAQAPGLEGGREHFARLALKRLRACRSPQELACVFARQLGYWRSSVGW
jgi:hypothetical protein